jgi:hypothetical protein
MNVTKQFVLAGKAIFTVELAKDFRTKHNLKPHYTFRVDHTFAQGPYPESWFVKFLTGSDNTKDYSYLGMLDSVTGHVRTTAKSKLQQEHLVVQLLNRVLFLIWQGDVTPMTSKGFGLHHEGRCGKCGKLLATPESVERGIGPECWTKMNGGNYPQFAKKAQQIADMKVQDRYESKAEEEIKEEAKFEEKEEENPFRPRSNIAELEAARNLYAGLVK